VTPEATPQLLQGTAVGARPCGSTKALLLRFLRHSHATPMAFARRRRSARTLEFLETLAGGWQFRGLK
jgi:hypothetical protein